MSLCLIKKDIDDLIAERTNISEAIRIHRKLANFCTFRTGERTETVIDQKILDRFDAINRKLRELNEPSDTERT